MNKYADECEKLMEKHFCLYRESLHLMMKLKSLPCETSEKRAVLHLVDRYLESLGHGGPGAAELPQANAQTPIEPVKHQA